MNYTTEENADAPKITRFEFITKENGREIVRYGEFTFQIQDNGKTLKVFQENKSNNVLRV